MNTGPAATTRRRAPPRLLGVLVASLISMLFVVACGLSWGAGAHKTELFRKLTITGDFHSGGTLTLHLAYQQPYNIDVRMHCLLLKNGTNWTPTPRPEGPTPRPTAVVIPREHPTPPNTVYTILEESLPFNPADGGDIERVTPVPGVIDKEFTMPEDTGRFTVRCFTPLDVNNWITASFTLQPRPS